jgi:Flp pilus assembly protein TadD
MFKDYLRLPQKVIIVCLLVAVTAIVYGQVIHHKFVNFDDDQYVTKNPYIWRGLSRQSIVWAFSTTYANFWHPLTWLSHILDCQLFGRKAGMHHLSGLLLHLASTVLLFLFLFKSTKAVWCSAAVAALFAIHPLHVESVAWVSERKDVLSTFFWMLTMWAYVGYAQQTALKRYLLVFLFFILGLMAKPMLVTLPFVLLLFDYWPLSRLQLADKNSLRSLIREKIPFLILALAAGIVAFWAQKSGGAIGSLVKYPLNMRFANAFVSYVSYIGKTLWPVHLLVPYPYPKTIPLWQAAGALVVLIGISVIALRLAFKYPYFIVGWLWYLGTLVPVIGLVQVGYHAMADRYTYVPLTGLFIIIAWGAADLSSKWHFKNKKILQVSSAAAILAILMILSWIQASYWKNSIKLFEHSLKLCPDNVTAHNNLGTATMESGDIKGAEFHFSQVLKIDPKNSVAYHNLGLSLSRQGKTDEAIKLYRKALKLNPRQVQSHEKIAEALFERGDYREAAMHFNEVLKVRPGDAEILNNLGDALMHAGKAPEAARYFSKALRIKSDYSVHYNLGSALLAIGKLDEAIIQLSESLRLKPDNELAHNNLGNALAQQGNFTEAAIHYREALRIKPNFAQAHCNLGIVLKRQGKKKEAAAEFSEALRINPKFEKARQNLKLLGK